MSQRIRFFLLFEALTFLVAALIHSGVFISAYEHHEARIAESVIAVVLFAGLIVSWLWPVLTAQAGLIAQAFALLGTLVGIITIIIGIGPRTTGDILYHIIIVLVLLRGLMICRQKSSE